MKVGEKLPWNGQLVEFLYTDPDSYSYVCRTNEGEIVKIFAENVQPNNDNLLKG